ncbi:MAG: FHA domain-containing protein [Planctomycetota bacterium]
MMLTLKILINKETQQEVTLRRNEESIGRSRSCTLRLTDTSISGLHAHIRKKGKSYILVDEGSTNGVYVNSVKIKQHELAVGDQIRLGRVGLVVAGSGVKAKSSSNKKKIKSVTKGKGVVEMRRKAPAPSKT